MDLKDLSTVLNEIHDARTKWYYIGIELKLDVSTLKSIESKYSDCKDCLREVITEWLKAVHPKPTWRSLVDALRRPVVDESKLAAVLESKYCPERRACEIDDSISHEPPQMKHSQAETEALAEEIQKLQWQLQDKEDKKQKLQWQPQDKEQQIREKDHIIKAQERPVKLPAGIRGSAAVEGNMAYFRIGGNPSVYAYDSSNSKWLCIYPECPSIRFGIAVINGLLTAIGGQQDGKVIGTLLSLTGEGRNKQWSEKFYPMPTKRLFPGILCYRQLLIIAGGTSSGLDGDSLSTVEVMDTKTLHWTTTKSLPHPIVDAWLTICRNKVYMLGGNICKTSSNSALTCSLNDLCDWSGKWDKIPNVPVYNATCATVDGQLLAVGGKQSSEKGTTNSSAIYAYNPTEKTWSIKCHMKTPRSFCLVAALPSNKLMVVGGFIQGLSLYDEATNEVEIISICLAPSKPRNLVVKGVVGELALKASWDAPSDNGGHPVVSYTVQIHEVVENTTSTDFIARTPLPVINASQVQFTYNTDSLNVPLTKNTVYEVQVAANNIAGPGPSSTARGSTVDKEALETALRKKRTMPLCIAQCMTVGAPQSGKSSLKRQLLKQTDGLNKSTGVADKPVVTAVTADGTEWTVLDWEDEGAQFLHTVDQPPSKIQRENNQLPTPPTDNSDMPEHTEVLQGPHFPMEVPLTNLKEPIQKSAEFVEVSTIPRSKSCSTDMELNMNQNEPEQPSYSDFIDTILDVGSEKWIAAKKRLENQCTIYFTDTGGQLEFQEVLPAIISGPSIFLLVFNLEQAAKGLDKEFPAVYKRSNGQVYEPPPGISTFSMKDSILHILASIQSIRSYDFEKDGNDRNIEAKVLLVGTHSDCVTDVSVRNRIECDMQKLLKDTPYYQKGLLQVPCRKQSNERFVYMVNNTSSKDPVFQEIREKVRSLIFKGSGDSDYKEDIYSPLLGFDLMLRWPEKPKILSYQHCAALANKCGISEDHVKEALTFLHERFGIIRYFNVKGLDNIVITNPQVIYNVISDLIAEQFNDSYSDCRLTPEQLNEFRNKGLISENATKCIAAQRSESTDLSLKFLLSLLSHLHIVVKLEGDENHESKYFIPCVLAGTIHNLSTSEEYSEPSVAELLIVFDGGRQYCPKGLFSVLAIKLTQKPKQPEARYTWELNQEKLGRERVVFHINVKDPWCRYTVHIQHGLVGSRSVLRIFLEKLRNRSESCVQFCPRNLANVCKEICDSIKSAITFILEELHKRTEFNIGFYSTCDKNQTSHKSHIAIIKDPFGHPSGVPQDMTCIDCGNVDYPLKKEHKRWFAEVPQVLDSRSQGLDLETVDGTTVLDEDDLLDVLSAVVDLAESWRKLGISLRLRLGDLKAILTDNPHSCSNCLSEMLTLWLKQNYKVETFGKPTWRRLVEAVEDHVGGNNRALAQRIARDHPVLEAPPTTPH